MPSTKFIDANFIPYSPSKWLTFDDVALIPQHSRLKSRNDPQISLSTKIGAYNLSIPLIAANMEFCEADMCIALHKKGGLGILHRFYKKYGETGKEKFLADIDKVYQNTGAIAFSIGIHPSDIDLVGEILNKTKYAIVNVDVASGDQEQVYHFIKKLSLAWTGHIQIIGGNVCTPAGANLLVQAGCHAIRVGLGCGSFCSTRIVTGFGLPQLTSILNIRRALYGLQSNVSLIADGGIRTSGDIAKALAAGADAVMIGRLFAGTDESAGDMLRHDGRVYTESDKIVGNPKYKLYRGLASRSFMEDIGKEGVAAEGVSSLIEYKGSVNPIIDELIGGIRSAFTYCGATNLDQFYENTNFAEVTPAAKIEATPHGLQ